MVGTQRQWLPRSAAHSSQAGARISGDSALPSVTDDLIKTSRDGEGSQTGSLSTEQPGPQKDYIAGEGGADTEQGEQTTLVQRYCQPDSEKQ